jgi:hypothetical protein
MLSNFVTIGAINEADTAEWLETAQKIGIEATKNLLTKIPVNKQSPVNNLANSTVNVGNNSIQTVPTTVAEWRNSIKNKK